ncbi:hypothetical protein VARIO8X_130131 [Burkholderiales bacterium 8X]|nr:hypothetical protein VARIO8X_130131 [Burkholderiales bacterium 8X]
MKGLAQGFARGNASQTLVTDRALSTNPRNENIARKQMIRKNVELD